MLYGQLCDECHGQFDEQQLDLVLCDGCEGEFHRNCGQYVMINREGQNWAYFFCRDCES